MVAEIQKTKEMGKPDLAKKIKSIAMKTNHYISHKDMYMDEPDIDEELEMDEEYDDFGM